MVVQIPQRVLDRIWDRIDVRGDDECWPWTGSLANNGYGQIQWGHRLPGAKTSPHRAAWTSVNGPIAEGLHIDHLCRNRACCNPRHLEPVTPRENLLRGQTRAAANAAKTHCPQGHPYSGDNLRVNKVGTRSCRTCLRDKARARRHSLRASA